MNPLVMPSLKQVALFKIATTLWGQDDIMALLTNYHSKLTYCGYFELWRRVERKVVQKVPKLSVPKCLEEEVLKVIRAVRLHTAEWIHYHGRRCHFVVDQPNRICWTPYGTVDEKKTAEQFVKNEKGDVVDRYKMACVYCFEDDIPVLWCQISDEEREIFCSDKQSTVAQYELVTFWTCCIKDEVDKLEELMKEKMGYTCTRFQYAFHCAAETGNTVATEFFMQKLTPVEREECVFTCARYIADESQECITEHCAQTMLVLLSEMTEVQKQGMCELYPCSVLTCFLDWPCQRLFMETASRMWPVMSEFTFHIVLHKIIGKIKIGYMDYNYQRLFREFWQQSPSRLKKDNIKGKFYQYMHILKLNAGLLFDCT